MKKYHPTLLIIIVLFINSCVSQSEHDKLREEKNNILLQNQELITERDSLQAELEEFMLNPDILIQEIRQSIDNSNFDKAKEKINILIKKHPSSPQTLEAKNRLKTIEEDELWDIVQYSKAIQDLEEYIKKYPIGKHITQAHHKIAQIKVENQQREIEEKKREYENIINSNSSSRMKAFLEKYPNHPQRYIISKKIIDAEVSEIMSNSSTGRLPKFQQRGYGYSATTTVTVKNDTGCELIVRYSGPDTKSITIPVNGTGSVYLKSGNYSIAASACGLNYGRQDNLQGQYSSKFYISSSQNGYRY